jgi:hypothetical protein
LLRNADLRNVLVILKFAKNSAMILLHAYEEYNTLHMYFTTFLREQQKTNYKRSQMLIMIFTSLPPERSHGRCLVALLTVLSVPSFSAHECHDALQSA